ncbi:MAG: DNA polymerase III subunit gamma/tau [Candidatus Magasanikbacteria bacterium]|nr:DNA polymerase III subunit gamma/tau [Candidatus Magasanikbacteria bacterium]
MTTLYRKYRPQQFSDLTGQEHIVQTVMNEITLNKIAHAYLFSGPRGVGKTTLARLLAKAVNCPNRKAGTSEPCGTCSSCQEIATGRNIDVIEIDAASHTGVDSVRENIIENAQFKPTKSPYKVFIVDEVHMLSNSAFNALLKTLEEPPAHVIFVLATTELHKLPATVVSRCQRFTFKKIPSDLMMTRLKKICSDEDVKVDKEVLQRIIIKSEGGMRDAESLLGQILSLNLKKITAADAELMLPVSNIGSAVALLEKLFAGETGEALRLLETTVADGINLDQFALDLLDALHALLLVVSGAPDSLGDFSEDTLKKLKSLGTKIEPATLLALTDSLLKRRQDMKTSPVPQLPLELLVVEFVNVKTTSPTALSSAEARDIVATSPSQRGGQGEVSPIAPITNTKPHTLKDSITAAISIITHRHTITTTLETITERWAELIAKIGQQNHSLTFILSAVKPTAVSHSGLTLSVPYSLHRDKLMEVKNRMMIESCLNELFGEKIPLVCEVAAIDNTSSADTEINSLAMQFGGEVVN